MPFMAPPTAKPNNPKFLPNESAASPAELNVLLYFAKLCSLLNTAVVSDPKLAPACPAALLKLAMASCMTLRPCALASAAADCLLVAPYNPSYAVLFLVIASVLIP